jgi:hypothetical protein
MNLQQSDVAIASPENQSSTLTVGIYRRSVRNYDRTSPGIRLEIEAGTPAIASLEDAQRLDSAKAIGCYISHSRVIQ